MRKKLLLLCVVCLQALASLACTSFIVSGRVTPDGRPLMFKNRDTGNQDNLMIFRKGEKYRFIGIVSAQDVDDKEVWGGHNEKGFAVMNTAAYNLNGDVEDGDMEGVIMRRALEICVTLKDFENLLDTLPKPLGSNANFGVIDAQGGCAYYEVGNEKYVKFDVNDVNVAPYGYLVRTNHAMSGERRLDSGVERYLAISSIMQQVQFTDEFDWRTLLTQVPRHLTHGLTHLNVYDFMPKDEKTTTYFPFRDFIPRYTTSSVLMVQGVKPGENPLLTVSWTMAGSPLTTVAVPLCILPSGKLPAVVTRGKKAETAPLVAWGFALKKKIFPLDRSNGHDYINIAALVNQSGTGILQKLQPVEKELLDRGSAVVETSRKNQKWTGMEAYYDWVDQFLTEQYHKLFDL